MREKLVKSNWLCLQEGIFFGFFVHFTHTWTWLASEKQQNLKENFDMEGALEAHLEKKMTYFLYRICEVAAYQYEWLVLQSQVEGSATT